MLVRPLQIKDIFNISRMYSSLSEEDRRFFHPCPFCLWKVVLIVTFLSISPIVSKLTRVIFLKTAFLPLIAVDTATNKCTGFAYLQMKERHLGDRYIATLGIVVSDEYKSRGIGSQLMTSLVNQAYENNVDKIILTVLAENRPAIRLYQKHGFNLINTVNNREFWDGRFYPHHEMELILNKDGRCQK